MVRKSLAGLAIVLLAILPLAASQAAEPQFYAKVSYLLTASFTQDISVEGDRVIELGAPPPPTGYELDYMEVFIQKGNMSVTPVGYSRLAENGSRIISYTGFVKIAVEGGGNLTAEIKAVYSKTLWEPISGGGIKVDVKAPEDPFTLKDLEIEVVLDNYAPYRIVDIRGPEGQSLLDLRMQEAVSPDAIQVDLKNAKIRVADVFGEGEYEIVVERADEAVLPNSFLVKEKNFYNVTIPGGGSKMLTATTEKGWKPMGYIVVVYSFSPQAGDASFEISAPMVDYVYFSDQNIHIEGVSFLIPPMDFRFWVKAYLVYGSWFKISNAGKASINVMFIPIEYKEAGLWKEDGVSISVTKAELGDAWAAFAVVQVPSYGIITDVVTPGGSSYGDIAAGKLGWFGGFRAIGVRKHQAYIQVKSGDAMETGTYRFRIEWRPIRIKVVDADGKPLAGAKVAMASGETRFEATTDKEGVASIKVHRPGVYTITAVFKGEKVAEKTVGTITGSEMVLTANVYSFKILPVSLLNHPLAGTNVEVIGKDGNVVYKGSANENGVVSVVQIPGGEYVVKADYKGVAKEERVKVDGSWSERKVTLPIIAEIFGYPITMFNAAAGIAATSTLALFLFLRRRRGGEEVVVVEEVF